MTEYAVVNPATGEGGPTVPVIEGAELEAGTVFVNAVLADGAELPFGGVKGSGVTRELGRLGFGEFVNKKLIRVG